MAKYQYIYTTQSTWMGASGNALVAIVNKPSSGKKINIHSIEIYNNARYGQTAAADSTPAPTKFKLIETTSTGAGEELAPIPMNTSSGTAWPSTVRLRTQSVYTPTYIQLGSTLTQSVTAGATTFTPAVTPSPAWTTNEHRDADRYFVVPSGNNAGVYDIASNSATVLTLQGTLPATESTSGYLAKLKRYTMSGIIKTLNSNTTASYPNVDFGQLYRKSAASGVIYESGNNSNIQAITIRAGESMAVVADFINIAMPVYVTIVLIRNGTPNRTWVVNYYTWVRSDKLAIFSLENTSGSGETIQVSHVSIAEVGTMDTPYFQAVPISGVHSSADNDSLKKKTSTGSVTALTSSSPALSSTVTDIYENVPVSPYGVPMSYISGAGYVSLATPYGYNYLNTKDFIGPTFINFFPEAATYKSPIAGFSAAAQPGAMGSQLSQEYSSLKGRFAPIVIREGEGFAIVSGAETAVGNSVGISGWLAAEFSIVFSIEDLAVITITVKDAITKLPIEGARVFIETDPGGVDILNMLTDVNGRVSISYSYSGNVNIVGRVRKASSAPYYKTGDISGTITATGYETTVLLSLDS